MIYNISVRDFAIIKDLSMELSEGLNIITGETGAGKSIIIEAVSMALGARADKDCIRSGAEKAVITIVADTESAAAFALMEEAGVPDDMPMVITREISPQRSLCRINGTIVPLSILSKICRHVADIHGQYDHQYLLDPDNHIKVLDLYAGQKVQDAKSAVASAYNSYSSLTSKLNELRSKLSDSARQKELLSYELEEIRQAMIETGEDERLTEEIELMKNSEQIIESLESARTGLFSGSLCALDALGSAMTSLSQTEGFSDSLQKLSQAVADCYYRLDDIQPQMRRIIDSIDYSQAELDEKTDRLQLLDDLKRKYGGSLDKVLSYAQKAEESLKTIENADEEIIKLEEDIRKAKSDYVASARKLTQLRTEYAKVLENKISSELLELAFADSRFKVDISTCNPSENGSDAVEFMISTNRGEEPRPLEKIVSGGELSRIMLALKNITAQIDNIPAMIFDEIDTGISGATAGVVGSKLSEIAETHQILCITHLPQIACRGQAHYFIHKTSDEISTHTTVVPLTRQQRVDELARLLSGTRITEAARRQAEELLKGDPADLS